MNKTHKVSNNVKRKLYKIRTLNKWKKHAFPNHRSCWGFSEEGFGFCRRRAMVRKLIISNTSIRKRETEVRGLANLGRRAHRPVWWSPSRDTSSAGVGGRTRDDTHNTAKTSRRECDARKHSKRTSAIANASGSFGTNKP